MVFTDLRAGVFDEGTASFSPASTQESVAELLRRRILRGQLGIGSRLRQAEIAADLGTSTTPVREALRTLAAEGFVEIDTHRGAVIRRLDAAELAEVLDIQLVTEQLTLAAALPPLDEATIVRAETLHERMIASDDAVEWALLNRDFHLTLSAASGRTRTLRTLREALNVTTVQMRQDLEEWEGRRAAGEADHARYVEVARARDTGSVHELVRCHISPAIDRRRTPGS